MDKFIRLFATVGDPEDFLSTFQGDRISISERNKAINEYWQGGPEKKYFVADYFLLDDYIAQSPNKEIALRVVNIKNSGLVDADWMSFPGEDNISDEDKNNPSVNFFIMSKEMYNSSENGSIRIRATRDTDCMVARLGRKNDNFFIIFNAAKIIFRKKGNGGIGNGGSSGSAQLPPR